MNGSTYEQVEHLRQADRGDHHHDPGPVEQPAEQQLGSRAGRGGEHERGRERRPVVDAEVVVELHHEHRGDDAELALGEVEDPVGPVDEDQPDGEQAVVEPADHAFEYYGKRDRHWPELALSSAQSGSTDAPPGTPGAAGRRVSIRSAVGPSKRTSPRSKKMARSARLIARLTLCSTRITVDPGVVDRADHTHETVGGHRGEPERELVDHEQAAGWIIITRPSASICCSPPDRVPARLVHQPLELREPAEGLVESGTCSRSVAPQGLAADLQVLAHRQAREGHLPADEQGRAELDDLLGLEVGAVGSEDPDHTAVRVVEARKPPAAEWTCRRRSSREEPSSRLLRPRG